MSVFETRARIEAPPGRVWRVLADLERWPSWTASIASVEPLDRSAGEGARYRVRQPKLAPAVWVVTLWEPGSGFVWESRGLGLRVVGEHWLRPEAGGTELLLRIAFSGLLAGPVALLFGSLTRRYMEQEAQGLKRRAEEP